VKRSSGLAPNDRWPKAKYNENQKFNPFNKSVSVKPGEYAPKCFNCQLFGYISRDCTRPKQPPKCISCGELGHYKKNCTRVPAEVAWVNSSTGLSKNMYTKPVTINNNIVTLMALVDTGSAVSIIKYGIVRKYGLNFSPKVIPLWGYGGKQSIKSLGETMLTLSIDDVSESLKVVVVEDNVQDHDLIVGRTFTDLPNVTFVKTCDQLIFAYGMEFPYSKEERIDMDVEARHFVTTKQQENIPALSSKLVEVEDNNVVMLINGTHTTVSLPEGSTIGMVHLTSNQETQGYEVKEITADMVMYNPKLNKYQVNSLIELLNKYRKCFAFSLKELGCTKLITMDIVDNNVPVMGKPYRVSAKERETIDTIVNEWKREGLVTETTSPYASPVLLVTKKTGEPRLVVDYRKLNSQTVRNIFPTPNLED